MNDKIKILQKKLNDLEHKKKNKLITEEEYINERNQIANEYTELKKRMKSNNVDKVVKDDKLTPFYKKTWFLIIMFIFLTPVSIFLYIKYHKNSKKIINILLTILLSIASLFWVGVLVNIFSPNTEKINTSEIVSSFDKDTANSELYYTFKDYLLSNDFKVGGEGCDLERDSGALSCNMYYKENQGFNNRLTFLKSGFDDKAFSVVVKNKNNSVPNKIVNYFEKMYDINITNNYQTTQNNEHKIFKFKNSYLNLRYEIPRLDTQRYYVYIDINE